MEPSVRMPKRSATYKELALQSPSALRLPEPLSRYSTRFHMVSYCPEIASIIPVYKPAPKPSKLLLDYLYAPKALTSRSNKKRRKKVKETPHRLDFLSPTALKTLKSLTLFKALPKSTKRLYK